MSANQAAFPKRWRRLSWEAVKVSEDCFTVRIFYLAGDWSEALYGPNELLESLPAAQWYGYSEMTGIFEAVFYNVKGCQLEEFVR